MHPPEDFDAIARTAEQSEQATPAPRRSRLPAGAEPLDRVTVGLLSMSHLVGDVNQGAVGPLAAILASAYHFSYASVGSLVLGTTVVSMVAQPALGYVADKVRSAWILPLGVLLASAGLALSGLTAHYWSILIMLSISGLGVAAYHPVGARLVNRATSVRRGAAMSVFSVGGSLGLALGSLLLTLAVSRSGLQGTAWFLFPGVAMAGLLVAQMSRLNALETTARDRAGHEQPKAPDAWGQFLRLAMVMIGRSIGFYGLTVFIPVYWLVELHVSRLESGVALTAVLLAGAAGTLIGGRLADAYGPKRIILIGLSVLAVCLGLLALIPGVVVADLLLFPLGLGLYAPHSVMVAMGQEMVPNHLGVASGLMLGLAVSAGGLAAPLLGHIGDEHGIAWVFISLAGAVAAAVVVGVKLPKLRLGAAT